MNRDKVLELAREAGIYIDNMLSSAIIGDSQLERFAALIEREVRGDAEPVAFEFQHEDTGLIDFVDPQQVEWGFQKNNRRWQLIGPVFRHPAPAVVRQPLTEAQITYLHKVAEGGDYLDFARLVEAKHGIVELSDGSGKMTCTENAETLTGQDERVKTCPECGSEDTRQVYEYDGGEKVASADECNECGHQWNVG